MFIDERRRCMKKVLLGALLFLSFVVTAAAGAEDASPEGAVRQLATEWALAWNRHDPHALAGFFGNTGDLVTRDGQTLVGVVNIEKLMQRQHTSTLKKSTYQLTVDRIHFVTPAIAVVDWTGVIEDATSTDGKHLPPQKEHVSVVVEKTDVGWVFAAYREGSWSAK
jgi:uncharacterized protein (TIGR02246 family)